MLMFAVLAAVSVVFLVSGLADVASFGGVLFVAIGAVGTLLFTAATFGLAGQLLSRRSILELDDEGVRLPARWPRSGDRTLPWPDVASAVTWSQVVSRRQTVARLAFLPRTGRPTSHEILALRTEVPGVPTMDWAVPALPGLDATPDDVAAHLPDGVPFIDAR